MIDIVSTWHSICVDCGEEFEGKAERCNYCAGTHDAQQELDKSGARITELEAQLAAPTWEPIVLGEIKTHQRGTSIAVNGEWLHVIGRDEKQLPFDIHVQLPSDTRLCRRATPAGTEQEAADGA